MENENNNKNEKSKNFLVLYSIALFVFAAILITLSYLSQARVANEADKIKKELSNKTQIASGFEDRLEQVNKKNADLETANMDLKKQIEDLTKKVSDLTASNATVVAKEAQLAQQIKRANACEYMWKLVKEFTSRDYRQSRKIIAEIDKQNLRSFLSPESLKELQRIENILKGD